MSDLKQPTFRGRLLGITLWTVLVSMAVDAAAQPPADLVGPESLVEFAGGQVQFSVPRDWNVGELPVDREVHLVLSPGVLPELVDDLRDGVAVAYLATGRQTDQPTGRLNHIGELNNALATRVSALPYSVQRQIPQLRRLADHPAIVQTYEVDLDTAGRPTHRGHHLLFRLPEGLLELRMIAPVAVYGHRRAVVDRLVASLNVRPPGKPQPGELGLDPPELAGPPIVSGPFVGRWKSPQSMLIFSADGRVRAEFDARRNYALDAEGRYDFGQPVTQLTGNYTAAGDLLRIRWDDGSRLNYRWRIRDGQLFLTDHHGRVHLLRNVAR